MRKWIITLLVAIMVTLAGNCYAAHKPEEAKALVKKAVAYVNANGKEKAFAEFSKPKGLFSKGELYIFVYDFNGMIPAHGQNQKLIGKNMIDLKDADGKYFVREFVKIGKQGGSGWVDYKWTNSVTKQIEQKTSYLETVGDVIVGCGIYK
jgi:cytochrome c